MQRAVGAARGISTPDGWRCEKTCRDPARRPPGDPSRPRFGVFDDVETAAADERVREALGLSSRGGPLPTRARWIGLHDGSRLVVGVCHAHNSPRGCPGHALALRYLDDATACFGECGVGVTTANGVQRAKGRGGGLVLGRAALNDGCQVAGWKCRKCGSFLSGAGAGSSGAERLFFSSLLCLFFVNTPPPRAFPHHAQSRKMSVRSACPQLARGLQAT